MKSLKQVLEASLLDIDANLDITDEEVIKSAITKFINDNYITIKFTISDKPNKDGKFEVSSNGNVKVKNKNITSLTNDLFVWDIVKGDFNCSYCRSLQSLEGSPKKVGGDFDCYGCNALQSLEGSPKKVANNFICNNCNSLTNLVGAPEEVGGNFECAYCDSLTSLEGAPYEVGGDFKCHICKAKFYEDDVERISYVKGKIKI